MVSANIAQMSQDMQSQQQEIAHKYVVMEYL